MPNRQNLPFWSVFPVPNPAVGADLIFPQPGKFNSRTFAAYFELVTDATVADRTVTFEIGDGQATFYAGSASFVQPASTTYKYSLVSSGSDYGIASGVLHVPLPVMGLVILPGWTARTRVTNLQAGDQIQNIGALIYEHPTGPGMSWDPSFPLLPYAIGD